MSVVSWLSGAYTDLDGATLQQMGAWRGRPMDICSFFPTRDNSATLTNTYYLNATYSGNAPALSIAMPMCYTGGSLAQDLSADMTTLANAYKADGRVYYIRLGWEFNLPTSTWPWAVTDANVNTWKSRFGTYANIFKTIMGSKVHIVLNPNFGANQSGYTGTMQNLLAASPYIDYAGPDLYDWFDGFINPTAIANYHSQTQGMDFWTSFVASNNLLLAVPEWGCVSGSAASGHEGGDNPTYITEMIVNWMAVNAAAGNMGYDTYFNETQAYLLSDIFRKAGDPGSVSNPNAGARYQSLFAGTNTALNATAPLTFGFTASLSGGKTSLAAVAPLTFSFTASLSGGSGHAFPQSILPIQTEIQVDGAWTDITSRVRSSDGINIVRGTSDESSSPEPATMSLTLNNRDGLFSPRNPMSPYYGLIGRNTPIRCSVASTGYAQITQATTTTVGTCYVSAPDTPATSITGDIDIRFDADLTSWRDSMTLYSKWNDTGNQRSYAFILFPNGQLGLFWSTNGSDFPSAFTFAPIPITTGRLAVRVTLDVNNGAGGNTATFYTAPSLAGPWTQLGDTFTNSGTTSIFNSTALSYLLDNPNEGFSGSVIHGRVYGAQVLNGINGTVVANPSFANLPFGTTTFVDSNTNVWTVNSIQGSLEVRDFDPRFTGEVTEWPQSWDVTGNDVWVSLQCADIRRRLAQGAPVLQSPARHAIVGLSNLKAYWPCEDGTSATSVASALPNVSPMRVTGGTINFAADSSFVGSDALPEFNDAQVTGVVPAHANTGAYQVRFLLGVPSSGTNNNSSILRIYHAGGGVASWALTYGTGGSLTLTARDSDDNPLGGGVFGPVGFAIDGKHLYMSVELQNVGANVSIKFSTYENGDSFALVSTGTLSSKNIGRVSSIQLDHGLSMQDVTFGHISVQSAITDLFSVAQGPMAGFSGETAEARMVRLSSEQGIPFQKGGYNTGNTPMGPQTVDTYLNLIQECADADGGILFSPRDWLALAYRPQVALMAQPADLTLDYEQHQMMSLQPVEDDQSIQNDVTVTRDGGSSFRAVDTTSSMASLAPPNGIGGYATSVTINVETDDQLPDQAGWRLRVGTVDEARYPVIDVELAAPDMANLHDAVAAVDVGSRLVVTNPPAWIPPDDISQLIRGYSEHLEQYSWSFSFNCSPSSPFDTAGIYGISYQASRYSSDGSTLNGTISSSATSMSVSTPSGPLWSHSDGNFDIILGGERMTVTAISGTTSPQTFTVMRAVNGIVKSHSTGEDIELFAPAYYTP